MGGGFHGLSLSIVASERLAKSIFVQADDADYVSWLAGWLADTQRACESNLQQQMRVSFSFSLSLSRAHPSHLLSLSLSVSHSPTSYTCVLYPAPYPLLAFERTYHLRASSAQKTQLATATRWMRSMKARASVWKTRCSGGA